MTLADRAAAYAGTAHPYDDRAAAQAEQGYLTGVAHERARVSAILSHAEAKGREAQARTLALDTDLTAEQAAKVLASTPTAPAVDPLAFLRAPAPAPTAKAAQIVAAYEKIAGPMPHRAKPASRRA